ncbi:hypothetical protein DFJ74DRAFT_765764 [Hyaloraphidium curvatum]|nr:hypothetical protein DFJ74DRAFT_765764 [Hyaloraphidium curvatum]
MVAADALYPPPAVSTVSCLRKKVPTIGHLGFNPALSDSRDFEGLVNAKSEKLAPYQEFLVDQGKLGGWAVENDPVLTAMLTLRNKYGFGPDATLESKVRTTKYTGIFGDDVGVEGIRTGYYVLFCAVHKGTLSPSAVCFLARLEEELILLALPEEDTEMLSGSRAKEMLSALLDVYCVDLYDGKLDGQWPDVLRFAAVGRGAESDTAEEEAFLRSLLEVLAEQGWLDTEAGRASLSKCRSTLLGKMQMNLFRPIDEFARIHCDMAPDLAFLFDYLLSDFCLVKPTVGYEILSDCMKASNVRSFDALGAFRMLLAVAALQPIIVERSTMAGKMAAGRGGKWQGAWEAYAAVYDA